MLVPEREVEVLNIVRMGESEFTDLVHETGRRRHVRLLSYEAPKEGTRLGHTGCARGGRARAGGEIVCD